MNILKSVKLEIALWLHQDQIILITYTVEQDRKELVLSLLVSCFTTLCASVDARWFRIGGLSHLLGEGGLAVCELCSSRV